MTDYHIIFPEFARLGKSLDPHDPSEVHGILCGMLCADSALDSDTWLERLSREVAEDDVPVDDTLLELFNATVSQLNDDELRFSLLLPDDEMLLGTRAASLGRWCQGFLFGLGLGGMEGGPKLPAEGWEFLNDVTTISRLGFDTVEAGDEDEEAYAEIVEYIRVGVMLVKRELHSPPADTVRPHLH